ncbi:hypothetical protein COC42_07610 [Sphingomonas spermidinifaciens]|uniref:PIN domain-containing protein n=1 Tax=Sphingomonas spermidinifaciens TaxID=1141889 RepID=A0A2A4B8A0_9SPHN|nr:type II toxin-antitoxin system VapC family toxin [Sphingomonas spermidinifaciens]PCD04155.1 hypothetical protein COC42_07610 [Sphingomonas spermidinifaciens]
MEDFDAASQLRLVPIDDAERRLALDAHARYGPRMLAALNMGDRFAYECAKAHGARLLSKGGNFARTDLS